jgi:hypothetical protein
MKELYVNDYDFVEIYNACGHLAFGKLFNGWLLVQRE